MHVLYYISLAQFCMKSKSKDRQHNGKKKNDKRTDNDLQNIAQNSKE